MKVMGKNIKMMKEQSSYPSQNFSCHYNHLMLRFSGVSMNLTIDSLFIWHKPLKFCALKAINIEMIGLN
jgi:hypothetical protein